MRPFGSIGSKKFRAQKPKAAKQETITHLDRAVMTNRAKRMKVTLPKVKKS